MPYQYKLYDLKISSTIKLNQLPFSSFTSSADVNIIKNKLRRPPKGKPKTLYKPFSVAGNNFFYLDVKGIARYKIADKNTLIVDKYKNATWKEVVLFLMDSVLSAIFIFHEKLVLKASAVSYHKQAFLFCGLNGVGKSALAASLHNGKIKIIEDDKCLLQWSEKQNCFTIKNQNQFAALWVDIKVWENSNEIIKRKEVRKGIKKFDYDIKKVVEKKALPVKKIFWLQEVNSLDVIKKTAVKGMEKIGLMRQLISMHHLIKLQEKNQYYFKCLNSLSKTIELIHLQRARSTSLQKFVTFVSREIYT